MQEIRELADEMRDRAKEYVAMAKAFRMAEMDILSAEARARTMTKALLGVEPSDAERATWPDATRAYVESLECIYDHAMACIVPAFSETK